MALRTLVARISRHGQEVSAAIESMNGARFVHDTLELAGWGGRNLGVVDETVDHGDRDRVAEDRPRR